MFHHHYTKYISPNLNNIYKFISPNFNIINKNHLTKIQRYKHVIEGEKNHTGGGGGLNCVFENLFLTF